MSRSRRFASATKAPGARSAPSRSRHPVHPAGDSHHCPGCGPRPWPSKAAIGPCTVKRWHDPLLGTISAFVVTRAGDTYKLLDPASGVLDVVPDEVADVDIGWGDAGTSANSAPSSATSQTSHTRPEASAVPGRTQCARITIDV